MRTKYAPRKLILEAAVITRLIAGDNWIEIIDYRTAPYERSSRCRIHRVATLRAITMYVICRELGLSTVVIGLMFNLDHSSVVCAMQRVERDARLHETAIIYQKQYESVCG